MTLEEKKAEVAKEILNLLAIYGQEESNITQELKRVGEFKIGLDSNAAAYSALNKKFDKLMRETFSKYDLPTDTQIRLW